MYYYYYSTWVGRPGIFLEDLFVRPDFRNRRIGKSLMIYLAKSAVREGCYGLRWEVLNWNKRAVGFYEHLGSEFRQGWNVMQITEENLKRMAARTSETRSNR